MEKEKREKTKRLSGQIGRKRSRTWKRKKKWRKVRTVKGTSKKKKKGEEQRGKRQKGKPEEYGKREREGERKIEGWRVGGRERGIRKEESTGKGWGYREGGCRGLPQPLR